MQISLLPVNSSAFNIDRSSPKKALFKNVSKALTQRMRTLHAILSFCQYNLKY